MGGKNFASRNASDSKKTTQQKRRNMTEELKMDGISHQRVFLICSPSRSVFFLGLMSS